MTNEINQKAYEASLYKMNVHYYTRQLQILRSILNEIETHEITSKEIAIRCINDAITEYYVMTRNVYDTPIADEVAIQTKCLKEGREVLNQIVSTTIEKLQF